MGMITGVGRLLRGLWGLMFGCVWCLSVGPGLLLLGLGPEEQSHSAGKPDTHLSRGSQAKAPVFRDAMEDGRVGGRLLPGLQGFTELGWSMGCASGC